MWKYRVDQHLTVINLYSVSINKILLTAFTNVKISKWNQQLSRDVFSKLIKCLQKSNTRMIAKHSKTNRLQKNQEIQGKWIEYKIFELKYRTATVECLEI